MSTHVPADGRYMTTIETEIPGILANDVSAIASNIQFYLDGYDIIVNRTIAARGQKVVLESEPEVCRFCSQTKPACDVHRRLTPFQDWPEIGL
ncbi:hypothetical protein ACVWYH_005080 [Bradyrhizobium sp. GM24.11]